MQCVKILKKHFDKIPNAKKIFVKFSQTSDEDINPILIKILRYRFNEIPDAPEIFSRILSTIMTTVTKFDNEVSFLDTLHIFSEHFYEIPDAKEMLKIFVNTNKNYIEDLSREEYLKNMLENIFNKISDERIKI